MYEKQSPVNALKKEITTLAHKCKAQSDSYEEGTDCVGNIVLYDNKDCAIYKTIFSPLYLPI